MHSALMLKREKLGIVLTGSLAIGICRKSRYRAHRTSILNGRMPVTVRLSELLWRLVLPERLFFYRIIKK